MSALEVLSPDGKWIALSGPRNTVIIMEAENRLYWGTYYGHQAGIYRRETGSIISLEWRKEEQETGFYLVSESSDGSKQEWHAPSCLHRRSITEAHGTITD